MTISQDVAQMFCVAKGAGVARHENSAIPEEGSGFMRKRLKTSADLPTAWVGVLPSRAPVN